ncbi:hypothetical protein E3P98_00803, partial [Wallemia ichthyophaga]
VSCQFSFFKIIDDTVKLVSNDNNRHRHNLGSLSGINNSNGSSESASIKVYPPLPQFQSGVSIAGFTFIMNELNRLLPTAEVKPKFEAQSETSRSSKSAAQLGLNSTTNIKINTNLKIKRKFDYAHKN